MKPWPCGWVWTIGAIAIYLATHTHTKSGLYTAHVSDKLSIAILDHSCQTMRRRGSKLNTTTLKKSRILLYLPLESQARVLQSAAAAGGFFIWAFRGLFSQLHPQDVWIFGNQIFGSHYISLWNRIHFAFEPILFHVTALSVGKNEGGSVCDHICTRRAPCSGF